MLRRVADRISEWILRYLNEPTGRYAPFFAPEIEVVRKTLRPCDVLLIEGNSRLSATIKFLTQSTWSHACLCIGGALGRDPSSGEARELLEAEAGLGVIASPLEKYAQYHKRICRPVGLDEDERERIIGYAVARLGVQYDSQRIIDLARYLFPYPPVPVWLRRRMLAIGASDPTKAICSNLIAEAFASVRYPILPERVDNGGKPYGIAPYIRSEIEHIRMHGLYTPRDFDVSPYFAVVKPTVEKGFDHRALTWQPDFADAQDPT
jgi:hypothetical protein